MPRRVQIASLSTTKPSDRHASYQRVHFHRLMRDGMAAELDTIAQAAGTDGIVYDMVRAGTNATDYTYKQQWQGATYTDLLTHARLSVTLAGDVWAGTELWNALEYGIIPVVERRASYKGCRDPAGWLRRSEAPVLWVDEWSDLPGVMADALSDEAALEVRREAIVRWWAAAKLEVGEAMLNFSQHWSTADTAAVPANDCATVALSSGQEQAYQDELAAFYEQEHWFENWQDSPDLESIYCWKRLTLAWEGLQCYSPKCAEPAVASFTCGNSTLSAKTF